MAEGCRGRTPGSARHNNKDITERLAYKTSLFAEIIHNFYQRVLIASELFTNSKLTSYTINLNLTTTAASIGKV